MLKVVCINQPSRKAIVNFLVLLVKYAMEVGFFDDEDLSVSNN